MKAELRVLVTGAHGQVGSRMVRALSELSYPARVAAFGSGELDITRRDLVMASVEGFRPDWIVNCAAYTAVDRAESEADRAYLVNAIAVRWLVEAAELFRARLCHFSTDYVFDGSSRRPYREWDPANPLSVYGQSKLAGEKELRPGKDLLIRSSWIVSSSPKNTAATIARLALSGNKFGFVTDQIGSPTRADDLVDASLRMMLSGMTGTFHVANQGEASWFEVARFVTEQLGNDPSQVEPITREMLNAAAVRPPYSVLDCSTYQAATGRDMAHWRDAVKELVGEAVERGTWK